MDTIARSGVGLLQDIEIGPHRLRSDEPADQGGTDLGPTPYELLCAALAACTSMTLRLYARQKGWALEQAVVTVRHDRIYAKDCAECETKEGRIDRLERGIRLVGALDDAQRKRLLEIADRCPVHRTLMSEIRIETRLV
jgi:putative redox protein